MTLSIDTISAFIAIDEDGEGVCAMRTPDGWMPMVAADKARIEKLRPIAESIAKASGKRIVLAEFSVRTDIEIIEPEDG